MNKSCKNCSQSFEITQDDMLFYDKISVPEPTFCPKCRLIRRLSWLKTFQLYKRICNFCKKDTLSMYPPDSQYNIYCHTCWWSDTWDPMEYGMDYDPEKPFLKQVNELLHNTPLRAQPIDSDTGKYSPYTNHVGHSKNCYLIFYSEGNEDTAYGFYLVKDKNVYDSSMVWECQNMYDVTNAFQSSNIFTGQGDAIGSMDCWFVKDCHSSNNCFGSINLRGKNYMWFNEQLTPQEYKKRLSEFDSGSYKAYEAMRQKVYDFWQTQMPRPVYDTFSVNVSGNYVLKSKNCHECYDSGYCEDSKYMMLIKQGPTRDCYDFTDFGWNATRIYDSITVGNQVTDVRFSQDCHTLYDVEYSKSCLGGSNLLGCVSLRNKDYCILNKQYSKEEYTVLKKQIIEKMRVDGSYGSFFLMSMSPHAYNETFAYLFEPKTKQEVLDAGLKWQDIDTKEYTITMEIDDIPDHIKNAPDTILKEVIQCPTCPRGYKIIHQELQFLRQHNLPLPRACPFCRIEAKVKRWVWQMTLGDRVCDNCGVTFRTHYRREDAPKIFCKECYNKEVV